MRDPNAKMNPAVLRRVLGYVFKYYKWHFLTVVICILITAVCTLQSTLFTRTLIDEYITPLLSSPDPDFAPLAARLVQLAGILLLGVITAYTYNRIMATVGQGTMEKLRVALFTHMESLPIKYFDTHVHGDIMSTYTNDIDTLRQLIGQSIPQLVNSSVTICTVFISMVVLNIPLTILSVVMVFVMLTVSGKLAGQSGKYFVMQQKDLGAVNGYIEEMLSGQKVVKVFNHEQKAIEGFTELNHRLRDSANNANKYANIMMPVMANIGNISYVLCAGIGAILALSGNFSLTLGTLVSFLSLNRSFSMPVTQISQQIASIIGAMAGAERVFKMMDEPSEFDEGYVDLVNIREDENGNIIETKENTEMWAWRHPHQADGTVTYQRLQGKVNMYNVDFSYDGRKTVLHDISIDAEPGQKIAFVGSTGAGKTTITNLINRFYDIDDGKIRYDDININKIKKPALRRSLGMVLQDTHLFTGTVMDNIRYGRLDATDEECMQAAMLARADAFIRRLPDGYNTMLKGDGGNLSMGQRQLLAIARCAVADPPAMILDEATSSIDSRTEKNVQAGMDALMKGRTTFVIAHRLSTVRNSDCIMVLEQGRIIERGSHDELIAKKGRYYQLYTGNQITE
ncbi:MAG: ABC transporter ATP-binding protein/permease [Solobacterium sp.]|nr:ABC transporter ATP-binding protein/permease [Solobacterium sp.]